MVLANSVRREMNEIAKCEEIRDSIRANSSCNPGYSSHFAMPAEQQEKMPTQKVTEICRSSTHCCRDLWPRLCFRCLVSWCNTWLPCAFSERVPARNVTEKWKRVVLARFAIFRRRGSSFSPTARRETTGHLVALVILLLVFISFGVASLITTPLNKMKLLTSLLFSVLAYASARCVRPTMTLSHGRCDSNCVGGQSAIENGQRHGGTRSPSICVAVCLSTTR
jgi:hypothetical protein